MKRREGKGREGEDVTRREEKGRRRCEEKGREGKEKM